MSKTRNDRKAQRRREAEARQAAYDALPQTEKDLRNPKKAAKQAPRDIERDVTS